MYPKVKVEESNIIYFMCSWSKHEISVHCVGGDSGLV